MFVSDHRGTTELSYLKASKGIHAGMFSPSRSRQNREYLDRSYGRVLRLSLSQTEKEMNGYDVVSLVGNGRDRIMIDLRRRPA